MRATEKISHLLIRYRLELVVVAVVLAALSAIPASRVTMDRSIESMFGDDSTVMPAYQRLKQVFAGNDLVLAVYEDEQLLDPNGEGLVRLISIRDRLAAVPGVKGVLSLDMLIDERILDREMEIPEQVRQLLQGFTHGKDEKTVSVMCMLYPQEKTDTSRSETISKLREIIHNPGEGIDRGMLAGEPVMIEDAFQYVEDDGRWLFTMTTLLLAMVILFCFRSIRWVCVPIAVVQLALLLTNGLLGALNLRLSMVSSMLTAVVTVIGVATVVHVIVRFREARKSGRPPFRAMEESGHRLVAPVFWACITDAVGFAALLAAEVGPVRDFGLMMAVGSLMVLISAMLLIPGLALWGRRDTDPHAVWGESILDARLSGMVSLVDRFPVAVGTFAVLISLGAIYGIRHLEVETDFTKNFRSSTPIVKSYELVESKLGGAGVLDVVVPAPDHLDWPYLRKILILEKRLRERVTISGESDEVPHPGLTKVISLADVIVAVAPRHPQSVKMRRMRNVYVSGGLKTMRDKLPDFYDALYGQDPSSKESAMRIMLRAQERQPSSQKQLIIAQATELTKEIFPAGEVTGYFVLLTNLIDSMLQDQWKTFGLAVMGIFLTMTVAFRSLRLAIIATLPNVIPILMVNGLMGWSGVRINMGAVMIAAVSVGLSIDGSIHYLMAFQRARREGLNVMAALDEVQQSVGRAMVLSTLALIVGFAALSTSKFVPTIYFGLLVSVAMLGALFSNLLWLPLLLRVFAPVHKREPVLAQHGAG